MKIAINGLAVSRSLPGLGRTTLHTVRALLAASAEHEIYLLLPRDAPKTLDVGGDRLHLVRTDLSLGEPLQSEPSDPRELSEWIDETMDVYYAPSFLLPPLSGARATVHCVHDLAWRKLPASKSEVFRSYLNYRIPEVLERADRIVCVSNATRNDVVKQFGADLETRVRVVPLGVDLARYFPRDEETTEAAFVAVVGSYDARKNIHSLLEAFPVFRARMRPCRLVMVGPADARAAKPPAVDFLGHLDEDELASLYRRALMVVQPTHYEGSGLPVLDAMACGTPVACADTAVFREIAGDAAHYFDPYDASSIARAMDRLARDEALRQSLSRRGVARAQSFPWEASANKLLAVFMEAVA